MWSMWNAPSDRDYYDSYGLVDDDQTEPEDCWAVVHAGIKRVRSGAI